MVEEIYLHLRKMYECAMLHGDMRQGDRKNMLNLIKQKSANILIATDVAARGIDIKGLDMVINYDLPQMDEYYIHRIGRTARAGEKGEAYTLLNTLEQLRRIDFIQKLLKVTISEKVIKERRIDVDKIKENLYAKVKVEKGKKKKEFSNKKINKTFSKTGKSKVKSKNDKKSKRARNEKSFSNRW